MAAQSLLARLGCRFGTLGSSAALALAFPLSEGDLSQNAHTAAGRIGAYADRTASAEKIGCVVMGTEVLSVGVATITAVVPVATPASTTAAAGINLGQGAAPSSPVNGDVWITSAGLFAQSGGVTSGPFASGGGGIGGTISTTQLAFGSGSNTIQGSSSWTITGPVMTFASGTTLTLGSADGIVAGLNIPQGIAPASPVNGDIWTTSLGFFARASAATYKLDGHIVRNDQVNTFSVLGQSFPGADGTTAPINIAQGIAPASPTNGDIWTTSLGFFARASATTYKLDGHIVRDDQVNAFSVLGQSFPGADGTTAPINIAQGIAPASPANGDIWTTSSGLFVRIAGATVGPLGTASSGTIGGAATLDRIAVGSGTNTLTSFDGFTFKSTGVYELATAIAGGCGNYVTVGSNRNDIQFFNPAFASGAAVGLNIPGSGTGPVFIISTYDGAAWTNRFQILGSNGQVTIQKNLVVNGDTNTFSTASGNQFVTIDAGIGSGAVLVHSVNGIPAWNTYAFGAAGPYTVYDRFNSRDVLVLSHGTSDNSSYTINAKLLTQSSTTTQAGFSIAQGTAPTSPINGDVWVTSAGMFLQAGGLTIGPFATAAGSGITGTATLNQVSVGSGSNTVSSSSGLTYNGTTFAVTGQQTVSNGVVITGAVSATTVGTIGQNLAVGGTALTSTPLAIGITALTNVSSSPGDAIGAYITTIIGAGNPTRRTNLWLEDGSEPGVGNEAALFYGAAPDGTTARYTGIWALYLDTAKGNYLGTGQTQLGSIVLPIVTKTGTYLVTKFDYTILADTSGGGFTVTLPSGPLTGSVLNIKKTSATGTLVISGNGKNIDGAASVNVTTLNQNTTIQYDGTQWQILSAA